MSMRRPRIKAAAILPPKRPARDGSSASSAPKQAKIETKTEVKSEEIFEHKPLSNAISSPLKEKVIPNNLKPVDKPAVLPDNVPTLDKLATTTKPTLNEVIAEAQEQIDPNDNDVFKSPPVVANHKRTESFSASDVECEKTAEDVMRNMQGPLSPVKFRQRIRPTPFFGMRRNSTQGYGSDAEDEPRRQRHSSTSSSTGGMTPQRIRPPMLQRIRTESSCSNLSEQTRDPSAKSTRKYGTSEDHSRVHATRKDFLTRFNGRIPEKSRMKMSDLIYYNPASNPMVAAEPPKPIVEKIMKEETKVLPEKVVDLTEKETCMPVPQLKLGPDGEMILDEQSLVIETTAEKEARETLANTKVVYMDEFTGNSGFYRRSKRTKDWSSEETIKFYRCLHTIGTDFSLMLSLFPNRSRRDLKLKFKKEEKTNLQLINKALLFPKTFDVAELKQELEKEQEELEAKQKQWEEINKQKAENKKRIRQIKKRVFYKSKMSYALRDGDLIYEQEQIVPAEENQNKTDITCDKQQKKTPSEKRGNIDDKKGRTTKGRKQIPIAKDINEQVIVSEVTNTVSSTPDQEAEVEPEYYEIDILEDAPESESPTPISEPTSFEPQEQVQETQDNIMDSIFLYDTPTEFSTENGEIVYKITSAPLPTCKLDDYQIFEDTNIISYKNLTPINNVPIASKNIDLLSENQFTQSTDEVVSTHVIYAKPTPPQSESVIVINPKIEPDVHCAADRSNIESEIPEILSNPKLEQDMVNVHIYSNTPMRQINTEDLKQKLEKGHEEVEVRQKPENIKKIKQIKPQVASKSNMSHTLQQDDLIYEQEEIVRADENQHKNETISTNTSVIFANPENRENHDNYPVSPRSSLIYTTVVNVPQNYESNESNVANPENRESHDNYPVSPRSSPIYTTVVNVPQNYESNESNVANPENRESHDNYPVSPRNSPIYTTIVNIPQNYESNESNVASTLIRKSESEIEYYVGDGIKVDTAIISNNENEYHSESSYRSTSVIAMKPKNGQHSFDCIENITPIIPEKQEEILEPATLMHEKEELKYAEEETDSFENEQQNIVEENQERDGENEIDAEIERFMQNDLGKILTDLINGDLVVVATEDENDSTKLINEIYVMNKETGRLSDTPLDLPEDVVNCIVEELNES